MNEAQADLLMIKGVIADFPAADREGVELAAAKLREILALHNDHGTIAFALVAAELDARG